MGRRLLFFGGGGIKTKILKRKYACSIAIRGIPFTNGNQLEQEMKYSLEREKLSELVHGQQVYTCQAGRGFPTVYEISPLILPKYLLFLQLGVNAFSNQKQCLVLLQIRLVWTASRGACIVQMSAMIKNQSNNKHVCCLQTIKQQQLDMMQLPACSKTRHKR